MITYVTYEESDDHTSENIYAGPSKGAAEDAVIKRQLETPEHNRENYEYWIQEWEGGECISEEYVNLN
jgi:hypothetical protein